MSALAIPLKICQHLEPADSGRCSVGPRLAKFLWSRIFLGRYRVSHVRFRSSLVNW